jgi:DNA-binding NarL/FixJ family response regulator
MFLPTQAQVEILEGVSRGLTNKAIALHTHRSVATVEYHIHRLLELTGFVNRVELAVWWQDFKRVNPFERYRSSA